MINMIKVKKIFDDDCSIIKSSLMVGIVEFVTRCCCFNMEDDDDVSSTDGDGVFLNKDGTVCGGEDEDKNKFDDDNIED